MLLSGLAAFGLTYVLPTQLEGHLEYYFLELVPITLNLTFCVIFTSALMDFFERRDRNRVRDEREVGAGAGAGEQNDPAPPRNDEDGASILAQIAQIANTTTLLLIMLGCEFFAVRCCATTADAERAVTSMCTLHRLCRHPVPARDGNYIHSSHRSSLPTFLPTADPCVVLPIYRANDVSDVTRIIISCVVHPVLQEL